MDMVSIRMWFKTQYHLLAKKKKTRNGHGESIRMWFKTQYHLPTMKKKTRNGHGEHAGCDSKHNITYFLRKRKQMDMVSMEDVIQNTISLTL